MNVQLEMEVLPAIGLPFDFASWSLPSLNTMRATNCQETFKPVWFYEFHSGSFMTLQEPWYLFNLFGYVKSTNEFDLFNQDANKKQT